MDVRELGIAGAWELSPRRFQDDRGAFLEWYKADVLAEVIGHRFVIAQANHSTSRRGVVRGVHFAAVTPTDPGHGTRSSQAKYVYCPQGAVLDVIVDIRIGSPTFGQWDAVRLDVESCRAVYLSEGLGHAFCALLDGSSVVYLCSTPYAPDREFGINPLDPALGLPWEQALAEGATPGTPLLSPKDAAAPSLESARQQSVLPDYAVCLDYLQGLRTSGQ